MRTLKTAAVVTVIAVAVLLPVSRAAEDGESGSLETAQFPDVVKFDFEKVNESYEQAGEKLGKVTPIIDNVLEKGQTAVEAGTAAKDEPSDENKRKFIHSVLEFVQGAKQSQAKITGLQEDVREIHSQTGILYEQAVAQTSARMEELRKEYKREQVKYKDMVARHKEVRRQEDLSDWKLRNLYQEEKRQAEKLNRLAKKISFQNDFLKALREAKTKSGKDFSLYQRFFAESSACLADIESLASNVPLVAKRLQLSAAMQKTIPSRKAAVAGFEKVRKTRQITQQIADQLNSLSAGGMEFGDSTEEDTRVEEIGSSRTYESWKSGEEIEYLEVPDFE